MSKIAARLKELNIVLPQPSVAVAAYVPFVINAGLVYISGQLPFENGKLMALGRVGQDLDLATAQQAARLCGLNILAQLQSACDGHLDRVVQSIKLGGFVASAADFYDQPKVINGASELMEQVFGDAGRHARAAVGVSNLPLNAAVEVDAIFALGK
jgi:enamine deaminase RidA (YjgF/YER057c/UK114 family)